MHFKTSCVSFTQNASRKPVSVLKNARQCSTKICSTRLPESSKSVRHTFYKLSFTEKESVHVCDTQYDEEEQSAVTLFQSALKSRNLMEIRAKPEELKSLVFGGEEAVKNVWFRYKVSPLSIFISDDIAWPNWLQWADSSARIIQAPQAIINRMLRAKKNESYAGHFPLPYRSDIGADMGLCFQNIRQALLLYKLRDPQNIGSLIKSAAKFGFDLVLLYACTSINNEKLIRASDGCTYDPSITFFEVREGTNLVRILRFLKEQKRLAPCFATPNQHAQSITDFARRLRENVQMDAQGNGATGSLLILGSEHHGLGNLTHVWAGDQLEHACIKMNGSAMESLNVAHAGAIFMHSLRLDSIIGPPKTIG